MLHNGNEAVGTDGRVNLYSDSILSCSPEFFNLEVLLEPLEEQFYLPTVLVEVSNLQSSQFHCVSQEHELTTLLLIEESYKPKMLWIAFLTAIDGQLNSISASVRIPLGILRFQLIHLYCKLVLALTTKNDSARCMR